MKLLGNIIWFVLGGFILALVWYLLGLFLCITIIGMPFGLMFFKFGNLVLWPFGATVRIRFEKHPIMNIIWIVLFGVGTAIAYLGLALFYAITIIGIPFAVQWFKLAKLTLIPFGAEITKK